MEIKNKKTYLLLFIMLTFEIIMCIFCKNNFILKYNNYIELVFWIIIGIFVYMMSKNTYYRNIFKTNVFKILLIYNLLYYIVYYLSGFIFGFMKSPLNFTIGGIVSNLVLICVVRIIQEYCRYNCIKQNSTKLCYILVYIIFVMAYMDFSSLTNLGSNILLFKYISSSLISILSFGLLANYISKNGDLKTTMLVMLPISIIPYIIPLAPYMDWFVYGVYNIVYSVLVYLTIHHYLYYNDSVRKSSTKTRHSRILFVPLLIIYIFIMLFIIGKFNIVSYSGSFK